MRGKPQAILEKVNKMTKKLCNQIKYQIFLFAKKCILYFHDSKYDLRVHRYREKDAGVKLFKNHLTIKLLVSDTNDPHIVIITWILVPEICFLSFYN